jgi:Glycosyltransferase like family
VIAFGCPIRDEEAYRRHAAPSIERVREADSLVIEKRGYDSIQQPYNEILEEAAAHEDLEAVILLHEDTTLDEPRLPGIVRSHLADPAVGVIGSIGARELTGLDWWNATRLGAAATPLIHRDYFQYSRGAHDADAVDGYLMIVSAAVAGRVRFDERGKADFHGYDVDFCFRVRARGFRVVVDDIQAGHWSRAGAPGDPSWPRAAAAWRRTWDPSRWPPEWRGSAPYGFFR